MHDSEVSSIPTKIVAKKILSSCQLFNYNVVQGTGIVYMQTLQWFSIKKT